MKAIIITHKTRLKMQWKHTLAEKTSFPMDNFCDISGTDVMDEIMKGKIKE